jgi:hypothetical protein
MNATTTAATTAAVTFEAGDVVKGRPVVEGKPQAARKGIVLGLFGTDASCGYVVWWYGMGAASMATTSLMFTRELTKHGDVWEFTENLAKKCERGCGDFDRARTVGWALSRHWRRMRSLRTRGY